MTHAVQAHHQSTPRQTEQQREAIGAAAADLNDKRESWLNPPGISAAELRKRTLTNLYNQRPTWLDNAHARLDAAVADAYGWAADLPDTEILERLLALNLERAKEKPLRSNNDSNSRGDRVASERTSRAEQPPDDEK